MNEAAAREVILVQAFETAQPVPTRWSEEDRAWATRVALDDAGPGGPEAFIARRAHHAMQRLGPREPAAASWLARRLWRRHWVVWALLIGFVAGVLADSIGGSQRINLLAPPLWAVLAWNLIVYVLLLGHGLARLLMRKTQTGSIVKLTERVLRFGRGLPGVNSLDATASGSAKALQGFASEWLRASAPLSAARATTLLHVAAASLAAGLIAGLYLRGLVLDYRAAWESTFLSAVNAKSILSAVLAPAVALSHIALPDAATFEAMRSVHGVAQTGAPAGPWIHLLALTLLIVVVLPRSVLALASALRAHWLARHLSLPLDHPYFQILARARQGEVARVFIAPYASAPGTQAAVALRSLMAKVLGDTVQIEIADTLAFGAEDDTAVEPPAGTTLAAALFDLAATPEAEHQGHFARALAAHAPAIMLIDEAAFVKRFKADPARIAQRRDAWRVLAVALGTTPVFVNSDAMDEGSARGMTLAMRSPVSAAS
jgi:hypothetical protein